MRSYEFSRYLKIRGAYGASYSPDGRRVAFLTSITGVPQLWEVPVEGGWPEQLTFHDERVAGAEYSPVRDEVLYSIDVGGNERMQLHLLDRRTGLECDLTQAPEAIHYSGGFSRDGERVAYAATRRNGTDFDIYVQEVRESGKGEGAEPGEPRLVWETEGYHSVAAWGHDGSYLIVSHHTSNLDNDLYRLDLATGEARHLTPHNGDARFGAVNVAPDGSYAYLTTDRDGEFLRLAKLDLATLEFDYLTPDDWDVEGVELSPDGRYLVASRNVDGYSKLVLFGGSGRRMPDLRVPEGVVGGFEFSPEASVYPTKLAFTHVGPDSNPDVWTVELPEGEPRRLTRSTTAGIPRSTFVKPRLVRYRSFDGLEVPAYLYEPQRAGEGPRPPVVVDVHGGPEAQERPDFNPVTQYLVNRGYAVFAPNVRGSTGYGKAYTHLDDVEKRPDSVRDLAEAARWLKERGHERVAVMGGSYGGFMVLAALTEHPDLFEAGVDIVGIANMVTFLENTGSYRRALRESEYGSLERDREFLRSISPIHKAERITAPLMVVHGKNDPRVPVGEAEQIVERVKANGGTVEYLLYEDEGHGLAKLKNRLDAYPKIAAFLDRHLGA
ncbi:Dipeptidyl aminopeptidase/acylaminoacyl-peptidase [Rubrobacter radiotolerans]|uniref:Dipeptidyl aminopeptidase/acylaminoacyl-peptidase n=1 Tax=Rubrobacter radiotolerans TaxID=42256 RepID=A0A023X0D2_RUBRA|nr:Dipeptidyl aminopeptidase/acylaminoacyl-peptidase [Rubrobacter radiotolerans]SMC02671.1 Dipeptidyl aminopeptidase/acylaminoacyl peptidase [Rubrobacter radiotolerans DSM 5868]